MPLVVHYRADLQLVHGFCCYDNIALRLMAFGAHDNLAANAKCQRIHACTHSVPGCFIGTLDFFTLAPLSQTRGHKHKLYKHHCSTNVGTPFFVNLVVDAWNYLPDNIIDFNSLSAFKHTINLSS